MIKCLLPENKDKPCYILLSHFLDKEYQLQPENILQHPLYNKVDKYKYIKREWEWLEQAEKTYSLINKTTQCKIFENMNIFYRETKKSRKITKSNKNNLNTLNTFPLTKININGKQKKIKAPLHYWKKFTKIKFVLQKEN